MNLPVETPEATPVETPEAAPVEPQALEAGTIAREMAKSFHEMLSYYKEECKRTPQEALQRVQDLNTPEYREMILKRPAPEASWLDLGIIAEHDPALWDRCWENIKEDALNELRSGHGACKAMEGYRSNPWQRAQFLAIRQELIDGWRPRNGVERQLLDTMAQAHSAVQFWLGQLTICTTMNGVNQQRFLKEQGKWEPMRVSESEAVDQAAAMVDRFNRIFLRTLRGLRDLRRYSPAVIVQNAEQVNIGEQQVNVK